MQSYLLHGENHPESRKRLLELVKEAKATAWEIVKFDAKKEKLDLNILSRSQSILGTGQYFVIENYFSGNKKALQTIKEIFTKKDNSAAFLFWESKSVSAKALEKYIKVAEYKIPKTLFTFLASFSPGNAKTTLKLLQKAKGENPPDMLLVMLSRQIRLLYCLLVDPENIDLPEWQRRNLEAQAKKFKPKQLLGLHRELLELDRKNKKSQLPEDLGASLDLLAASL